MVRNFINLLWPRAAWTDFIVRSQLVEMQESFGMSLFECAHGASFVCNLQESTTLLLLGLVLLKTPCSSHKIYKNCSLLYMRLLHLLMSSIKTLLVSNHYMWIFEMDGYYILIFVSLVLNLKFMWLIGSSGQPLPLNINAWSICILGY